jgi:hypothetical protein
VVKVRSNFKAVIKKLEATFKVDLLEKEIKALAAEAIRMIQVRTRLGYGVDTPGGKRFRLKPLSEKYVERRAAQKNKLSEHTSPNRSNLTFSGELLDSLDSRFPGPGKILIEPTGTRKDGTTNQAVAASVTEGGRPFLALSDLELKKLNRFFEKEVLEKVLRRRGLTR